MLLLVLIKNRRFGSLQLTITIPHYPSKSPTSYAASPNPLP